MRSKSLNSSVQFNATSGLSLLEIGLVMGIVALALVPMVKTIGGPMSSTGKGSASQLTGFKNKEGILATSLANAVLAGDHSSLTCGRGSLVSLPTTLRTYDQCTSTSNDNLKYEWTVLPINEANSGSKPSTGYAYYKGVLNIYENDSSASSAQPLLSMPVNFFEYDRALPRDKQQTGVLIALDRSGSMAWGERTNDRPPHLDDSYAISGKPLDFALPFLWYRYKPFPRPGEDTGWGYDFPVINAAVARPLDMWNNDTLDLVNLQNMEGRNGADPDLSTPYNESYMGSNPQFDCITPGTRWIASSSGFDKRLAYIFNRNWVLENDDASAYTRDNFIRPLCQEKTSKTEWSRVLNEKLSRIEAARTAALSLLLKLEERPNVSTAIKVGYFPWAPDPDLGRGAPLQIAVDRNNDGNLEFDHIREKMLWLNRMDPENRRSSEAVNLLGGTNIFGALQEAKRQLLADTSLQRRILVLMTDGQPAPDAHQNSSGPFGSGGLRDYAKNILGCAAPKGKRITLFTVGLIQANKELMADMAAQTPNGQDFFADDIASLGPIFDTVAYEIQKLTLLSTADRYRLDFSNDENTCD